MEPANEEYQNDKVHVVVHRKANCLVDYEVEVFKPLCFETKEKATKDVGKELVIPGFRKGKAPMEIVEKRFPHDIDKRWQENLANRAYKESAHLAQVHPLHKDTKITFKMHSHSLDQAKLTLSFETLPQIPDLDPKQFDLASVERPVVDKEKVEELIRQAQMFFGEWQPAEKDHEVKEGDFVLLDIDTFEEDVQKSVFKNTRFEVTDRSMAHWLKNSLLGKKAGDVFEAISQADASSSEEEKKEFLPKNTKVHVKKIEHPILPPLDDHFAKQLGVGTFADLPLRLEALLNKKADQSVQEKRREQAAQFLASIHFEIPSSVVEEEIRFRFEQMAREPHFKQDWEGMDPAHKKEFVNSIRTQAENAVRLFYLCRKISLDQKFLISGKDLGHIQPIEPLEHLFFPEEHGSQSLDEQTKQAETYSRVLLEKVQDWMIANAKGAPSETV